MVRTIIPSNPCEVLNFWERVQAMVQPTNHARGEASVLIFTSSVLIVDF